MRTFYVAFLLGLYTIMLGSLDLQKRISNLKTWNFFWLNYDFILFYILNAYFVKNTYVYLSSKTESTFSIQ